VDRIDPVFLHVIALYMIFSAEQIAARVASQAPRCPGI
jgi:hypothetical protein